MIEVLICAVALVAATFLVGTLVCRLCGERAWTWLSGPVGLSATMLVGLPMLHAPGRMVAAAVLVALLALGGLLAMIREPALRPPRWAALGLLPTFAIALIPFAANERFGVIGVSFNNDPAAHMLLVDGLRSAAIEAVNPLLGYYPLGPHAVAALTGEGLGVSTDVSFAAVQILIPLLTAGLALEILRHLRLGWRILAATVTAFPYLVASYHGQGAFKEPLAALLTVGVVAGIVRARESKDVRRLVPIGLLLAGMVSAYSYPGLVWPILTLVLWALATGASTLYHRSGRILRDGIVSTLPAVVLGGAVFVAALLPQVPRIRRFIDWNAQTGIAKNDLGNLAGPISPFESLGVWFNPDFRFPPLDDTPTTLALVVVAVALLYSLAWWLRLGWFAAPAALVATALVWMASDQSQSPYVVAKALCIASPFVMLLVGGALFARRPLAVGLQRIVPVAVGLFIASAVLWSSADALRSAQVGPRDHQQALAALRADIGDHPTLFLGIDDFVAWELRDTPVTQPLLGQLLLPLRPEKGWTYGQGFDVDSVPADVLDQYQYVIAPNDPASSAMPANFKQVTTSGPYRLYRRTGRTAPRSVLAEGPNASTVLDCTTPEGRALSRRTGTAAVRPPGVSAPLGPMLPGATAQTTLPLTPGTWDLSLRYTSDRPITLRGPGLEKRLPAVLDRPGPRWPAGSLVVSASGPVPFSISTDATALGPDDRPSVIPNELVATPRGGHRTVPLSDACGQSVDWYRTTDDRKAG